MGQDQIVIAGAVALTLSAVAFLYACTIHYRLARRIRQIERGRAAAAASPELARIMAARDYTEELMKRESALMTAIGPGRPLQLYRREGSRFVAHGEPS